MLIRLIAPGQPVSAKNHMRPVMAGTRQIIVKGKAADAWYGRVVPALAQQFAATGLARITQPVHVETHQFVKHAIASPENPDGDNAQTACWDALVKAFVLTDDRLILSWGGSRQQDAARPRVEIEIRVLGE